MMWRANSFHVQSFALVLSPERDVLPSHARTLSCLVRAQAQRKSGEFEEWLDFYSSRPALPGVIILNDEKQAGSPS